MARPRKTGLDYFPHDTDAHNRDKLVRLRARHGLAGLGFWWSLLEVIYASGRPEICAKSEEDRATIALLIGCDRRTVARYISSLLDIQALDPVAYQERGVLTSMGIVSRLAEATRRRVSAAITPAETGTITPTETGTETPAETSRKPIHIARQRKGKKTTVKDTLTPSIPPKSEIVPGVFLFPQELEKLQAEITEEPALDYLAWFGHTKAAKSYKYTSDYDAILSWRRKDRRQNGRTGKAISSAVGHFPDACTDADIWAKAAADEERLRKLANRGNGHGNGTGPGTDVAAGGTGGGEDVGQQPVSPPG